MAPDAKYLIFAFKYLSTEPAPLVWAITYPKENGIDIVSFELLTFFIIKLKTFKNKYGEYKQNSLHTYPMRRIWKIIVAKEEPYKSKNLTNLNQKGELIKNVKKN